MNSFTLPSVSDISALLAALEAHPIGAAFLLLFLLIGVLALWVYRRDPIRVGSKSPKVSRG